MNSKEFFEGVVRQEDDHRKGTLEDILIRFLTDEGVWKDIHFGADENRLYIDGAIEYKNDFEKKLIEEITKGK